MRDIRVCHFPFYYVQACTPPPPPLPLPPPRRPCPAFALPPPPPPTRTRAVCTRLRAEKKNPVARLPNASSHSRLPNPRPSFNPPNRSLPYPPYPALFPSVSPFARPSVVRSFTSSSLASLFLFLSLRRGVATAAAGTAARTSAQPSPAYGRYVRTGRTTRPDHHRLRCSCAEYVRSECRKNSSR